MSDGEARPNPSDERAAAFFDVDNTMMVGASIFHFAKGLAARDFFSWHDLSRFAARQVRLRLRGETHGDLHSARESALAFVAGKQVDQIVALGEEIWDESMAEPSRSTAAPDSRRALVMERMMESFALMFDTACERRPSPCAGSAVRSLDVERPRLCHPLSVPVDRGGRWSPDGRQHRRGPYRPRRSALAH